MKAPGQITTIAIATLATVVLATVAFALATPSVSGPDDTEVPVIATDVAPDGPEAAPGSGGATAPDPVLTDGADDADDADDETDDHETVVPEVRVEGDDDDDEAESSEHEGDGESSEQHDEADDTHE